MADDTRTEMKRPSLSVVAFVLPALLLMLVGFATGSLDLGRREFVVWSVLTLAGLTWIWWPRPRS